MKFGDLNYGDAFQVCGCDTNLCDNVTLIKVWPNVYGENCIDEDNVRRCVSDNANVMLVSVNKNSKFVDAMFCTLSYGDKFYLYDFPQCFMRCDGYRNKYGDVYNAIAADNFLLFVKPNQLVRHKKDLVEKEER